MSHNSEIAHLPNLGPKSAQWLAAIGIHTRQQLAQIGAVDAYRLLKLKGYNPSLILVYAIQGALDNIHWTTLPPEVKADLQREAAD
jgi:hypothetical protein